MCSIFVGRSFFPNVTIETVMNGLFRENKIKAYLVRYILAVFTFMMENKSFFRNHSAILYLAKNISQILVSSLTLIARGMGLPCIRAGEIGKHGLRS